MKITKFLCFGAASLALFAGNPALAQDAATKEEVTSVTTGTPALWKVADEDTTVYLFGTIHALPDNINWYNSTIAEALTSSDALVTEIHADPTDPEQAQTLQRVTQELGTLPEGTTLRSLLNEEQTAAYENAITKIGLPVQAFDKNKPWLAAITLALVPLLQQGYSPTNGVENVLTSKVPEMPRESLETVEFQLGIFDSLATDQQIEFMMSAVEGIDDVKDALDGIVAEWAEGDTNGLAELLNAGFVEDPTLASALLYDRNANWAEWIDERLETPGTVFIAVGSGHLAGDKSVQDYLAKRDIAVERVQ